MLWLCIHLPSLPLEALAVPPEMVAGIVERRGARRQLTCVSESARQRGLHPGLLATAALTLAPEVRLLERNADAEQEALEAVACWAYRFGAPVTYSRELACVWVEIRHSLRMFGGWRPFRIEAERDANTLSYERRFGVAPTLAASALLARDETGFDRPIGQLSQLPIALQNKPLTLLPFDDQVLDILYGSGLRTIGEVLKLPRDALSRRFGLETGRWLDQLIGEAPEAWESFEPPSHYRRRFELAGVVTSTQALLFPLRAMIGDFSQYLRACDRAVQQFRFVFVDGLRQRIALDIGMLAPTRDPVRLMLVLRECLDKLTLNEGVQEILLEADRFEDAQVVQEDLFGRGHRSEGFETLQERLVARLGQDAVRRLVVTADHRPEKAWSTVPSGAPSQHPPRPLWLLAEPEIIAEPRLLGPPERIECGWWDGRQQRRDYFLAEDAQGRQLWVFREPDHGPWRLHGLWQ
jgi:protein ImuB